MAAVTPIIDCLPNFIVKDAAGKDIVVEWKRYLFYMLGYCDTYHDFHGSRLGDSKQGGDRGDIVRLVKTIGSLSDFSKDVIRLIDPNFNWQANVYNVINTGMGGSKKYSFENAMFNAFTKTIATPTADPPATLNLNPLAQKMTPEVFGQEYMKYLHETLKIRQDQILDTQILTMNDFSGDTTPEAYSSIVELEMPAILKTNPDKISDNLHKFIEKNYTIRIDKGGVSKIPFVEDTASFPRSIFQGYNRNIQAEAFLKIETPQTLWDPAGLSVYLVHEQTKKQKNIAAPSFLAKQTYSDAGTKEFDGSAFFNGTDDTLVLPPNTLPSKPVPPNTFNLKKYSGPSVNHLVLHMILNTPGKLTNPGQRTQLQTLINASTIKNTGNYTFKVDVGPNDDGMKQRLRNYTSSKRSGDYENIHSAMVHNAIMFTGDEPAFLYAVMNRCPIIYHLKSEIRHTFRFYIPPPPGEVAVAIEDTRKQLRDYVHAATELVTVFGTSVDSYKKMFESVQTNVRKPITVTGNATYGGRLGTILKGALVKNIKDIEPTIDHIVSFENIKARLSGKSQSFITSINAQLSRLAAVDMPDIKINPGKETFETLKREVDAAVADIKTIMVDAETKLSSVRDLIPRKFKGDKKQGYQFFNLFEETPPNQSCFSIDRVSYKLGETKILPDLPKTFNMAFKKLAQIASNIERGGRRGGGYDLYGDTIIAIKDILTTLGCEDTVINTFTEGGPFPENLVIDNAYKYNDVIKTIVDKFNHGHAGGGGEVARILSRIARDTRRARPISSMSSILYPQSLAHRRLPQTGVYETILPTHGRATTHRNRNTRMNRKQAPIINYTEIYDDILEQATAAEIEPFGLTPEEYAASIVYRCILVDKLHAFFYPSSQTAVALEPIIDSTPVQLDTGKMVGGALNQSEEDYILYIQNEVLRPFWEKYFVRVPSDPSFIDTIYSNSFLPDYISVLDEIIGAPLDTFTDPNIVLMTPIIANAVAAKNKLIEIKKQDGEGKKIRFRTAPRGSVTKKSMNDKFSVNYININTADEFTYIRDAVTYFLNMLTFKPFAKAAIEEKDLIATLFPAEAEPNTKTAKFEQAQTQYLHFYFKAYMDVMFNSDDVAEIEPTAEFKQKVKDADTAAKIKENSEEIPEVQAAAPAARAGGSRKTRRRARAIKQRKSKRRVPRRKRNNK